MKKTGQGGKGERMRERARERERVSEGGCERKGEGEREGDTRSPYRYLPSVPME